jgi:hypothetical protein
VLQKLATSAGTNLGKGPYPVSGCKIWQQVFLKLPDNCFDGYPLRRRFSAAQTHAPQNAAPRLMPSGGVADSWTILILEVLTEKGELQFTRLSELVEASARRCSPRPYATWSGTA